MVLYWYIMSVVNRRSCQNASSLQAAQRGASDQPVPGPLPCRCLRVPSFQIQDVVFDPKWDLLAFVGYLPAANAVVAVFRGTDSHSWGNWIENLRWGAWALHREDRVSVHCHRLFAEPPLWEFDVPRFPHLTLIGAFSSTFVALLPAGPGVLPTCGPSRTRVMGRRAPWSMQASTTCGTRVNWAPM